MSVHYRQHALTVVGYCGLGECLIHESPASVGQQHLWIKALNKGNSSSMRSVNYLSCPLFGEVCELI